MGNVRPLAVLVTVGIPGDCAVDSVDKFYKGMEAAAKRWKVGFLGGDTVGSRRDWFVSVAALGEARPDELISRSGARPGDILAMSGPLGMAAAGLEVLQRGKRGWRWTAPLVQAFSAPEPRLALGAFLGEHRYATSLMDCSDGLEASALLLAESSAVGMEIDLETLPIPPALARWSKYRGRDPMRYALSGGEDYELVFTVPHQRWPAVSREFPRVRAIGRVLPASRGRWAMQGRRRFTLRSYGFAHFR